jgi:aldehyde dehydrogenase (NAD+)
MNIQYIVDNFEEWAKPRSVDTNLMCGNASSKIIPEPFGCALVIGAWNYPFYTTVAPAAEAIAAGNCVCLKPSEMSPNTSNLMKEIFDKYLDKNCYTVIEGGPNIAKNITTHKWDLIIFTGSPEKGKLVAKAAAENLIPCILELGGKNPTIVDKDANVQSAAMRIAASKFLNCGQTCIAPDYVYCHSSVFDKFIEESKKSVTKFYTDNVKDCVDYSRIINEFHTERIANYLDPKDHKGKVVLGGKVDLKDKYIEPTIIAEPSKDSKVMKDEIFGPILPVLKYDDISDVIGFINANQKPLALYYYGDVNKKKLENETSSGAFTVNDCVAHILNHKLPFGGVG